MKYLFHTDLSKVNFEILRNKKYGNSPQYRVINYLKHRLDTNEIWFPAFNYNFGKMKTFSPKNDTTNVGAINAAALKMANSVRTYTPIFSYVGFGKILVPKIKSLYKPFRLGSELDTLLNSDSEIIFLGADFSSFTFIHFIEEMSEINYRYNKKFEGFLWLNGKSYDTAVEFFVRPKGKKLRYDWTKIEFDLEKNGLLHTNKKIDSKHIALNMSSVYSFIEKQINLDPYYLLDTDTKSWIKEFIRLKKRMYSIKDFE